MKSWEVKSDMHERPKRWLTAIGVPVLASLFFLVLACGISGAHGGEDHGAPQAGTAGDPNAVVRAAASKRFEVVLKYRSLADGGKIPLRIYVSDFETNAPIPGATVEFATTVPAKFGVSFKSVEPGVYDGTWTATQAGRYMAILSIVAGGEKSEFALSDLPLGESAAPPGTHVAAPPRRGISWLPWILGTLAVFTLVILLTLRRMRRGARRLDAAVPVLLAGALFLAARAGAHGGEDHSKSAGAAGAGAGPRYVAKESQFLLGVRTVVGAKQRVSSQLTAVGRVTAESGALASVSAPQTGRMERAGRALLVGDRVRRGQLLGYLLTIDRLPIRAPITGLVADVDFASGQWVQAGQELMRILDERQVRVEVPFFGENLTRALGARKAVVRTSALPNRLFPARLRGLAPLAGGNDAPGEQEVSGEGSGATIPPVILSVENVGGLLRPGMIVEASLELPDSREVITLPEGAIVYQESGPAVFVHTAAELFELRPVALKGRYLDRVEVEGELRAGERIVSEGAYSLVAAPASGASPKATTAKPAQQGAQR